MSDGREKELLAEMDILTAERESLEIEVAISRKTIQHFLNGTAPVLCDQCGEKLYNLCGVLACSSCKRGWENGEWLWTEWTE